MATYIVDATIVMNYLIKDQYTINAKAFFDQVTTQDRLLVPEFCFMECTNVLWKQIRFHGLSERDAEKLLKDLYRLPFKTVNVKRVLPVALQIGTRHTLAIYDSVYIALALQLHAPLLTVDQKQSFAAGQENVTLLPITQFQ